MVFKNILTVAILAFLSAFSLNELFAQERQEKHRVVVIEKSVDENGKLVEKKVVKEGDEAKAYIEKMGEGQLLEGNQGMKKEKQMQVKVNVEQEGSMKKIRITQTTDGNEEVMEFEYEGEEMPPEIKDELEKRGIDLEEMNSAEGEKVIRVEKTDRSKAKNSDSKKAQLGVNIEGHPAGIYISGIIPKSSADMAGLVVGDIITKVDDKPMKELEDLVGYISAKKAQDIIIVHYERDGVVESQEVVLQERIDPFPYKTWEEVMQLKDRKERTIEIEKEIIIEEK